MQRRGFILVWFILINTVVWWPLQVKQFYSENVFTGYYWIMLFMRYNSSVICNVCTLGLCCTHLCFVHRTEGWGGFTYYQQGPHLWQWDPD